MKVGACFATLISMALTLGASGCEAPLNDAALAPSSAESISESPAARSSVEDLRARFVLPAALQRDSAAGALGVMRAPTSQSSVLRTSVASGFEILDGRLSARIPEATRRGVARTATVALPLRAGDPVRLEDDTSHVAVIFALRGASDAIAATTHGIARYPGALAGADVLHRVHAEGTEDYVVFEERPGTEEIAYDVDVSQVAGLRLVGNTLEFLDDGGAPRLRVAPPYVVDASSGRSAGRVTVEGCVFDASPRAPWGREVTPPGASHCTARVAWKAEEYPAIVDPGWTATGSMSTGRQLHTATLLGSGKVLIAGGIDNSIGLASAELFDPTTGTFAATGSMATGRLVHTATLLGTGNVMIAGGAIDPADDATAGVELYDPATGTFTATASMTTERGVHTATMLDSGKVLIAGGFNRMPTWTALSSAEVYDPSTGTFAATGSMTAMRGNHTAAPIGSGKLLVAGGFDGNSVFLSSAEVYDSTAETFAATGSMATARGAYRAATLPGSTKVLVIGGCAANGSLCGIVLASTELYDPTAGAFAPSGSMTTARLWATATGLPAGKILLAGGWTDPSADIASSAEVYDPTTGTFAATASMTTERAEHTATLLGSGDVLIAGGQTVGSASALSSAEVFSLTAVTGMDAGADSGADSGPGADSGVDSGLDGGTTHGPGSPSGGCSCHTAERRDVPFHALACFLVVGVVGMRRRRRSTGNARVRREAMAAFLASCGLVLGCGNSSAIHANDAVADAGVDSGPNDAGTDASPPNKTPITGLPSMTWTWVGFPEARCRDGSSTGIGISLNPSSSKVMIFLEGGGYCVDATSCDKNPSNFGEANLDKGPSGGVFDRTNSANPVRDWSQVYVPYCTGDFFIGGSVTKVSGVGTQQFVGYADMGLYLDRLVPTFANATQVLLTGVSAGGYGAAGNYLQTARAFGSIPVDLLDDSGPFLEAMYATNPWSQFSVVWALGGTVFVDCGSHCSDPAGLLFDAVSLGVASYPKSTFGLADATNDGPIGPGLLDVRAKLAAFSNFGAFIFAGTDHTSIHSGVFYTRTAGGGDGGSGVLMTDWMKNLLDGTATNPGP